MLSREEGRRVRTGSTILRFLIWAILTISCWARNPLGVAFEAREGQYVSRGSGYSFSVTSHGAVLNVNGRAVGMALIGASPKSSLEGLDRMPGKANYLLGGDVRVSYELYGRVRWREAYSGIDVVFRRNHEHIQYEFDVR